MLNASKNIMKIIFLYYCFFVNNSAYPEVAQKIVMASFSKLKISLFQKFTEMVLLKDSIIKTELYFETLGMN